MLGERLKKLRGKKPQEEVSHEIGISRARLSHYETGRSEPDIETLNKLADYYGVSTDFLLTGKQSGQLMIDIENPGDLRESPEHVRFPLRLKKAIDKSGVSIKEISSALNIHEKDFEKWYLTSPAAALPNKEALELISSIVGQPVDYLLGYSNTSMYTKDEKDIAKRMEQIRNDLTSEDGLMFNGEPMSEEAIESFLEAMEYAVRQTQRINKKYIPKKYRDNEEN